VPWAILGVYAALCVYLGRATERSGDGAAYVLQAMQGSPTDRPVHVGYLLPLWLWVRGAATLGVGAATAANTLAALTGGVALLLAGKLGRKLAGPGLPDAWAALPALSILGAAASWDGALFAEVHAPLAALLLGASLSLCNGHTCKAGLLLAWAACVHPAAWVLVPGVLVAAGPGLRAAGALRLAAGAAALWGLAVLPLLPALWSGGRGILDAAPMDRSPWESLQAAWRLLSRDMGLAALPLLAGAAVAAAAPARGGLAQRRYVLGLGAATLGSALMLDRYRDNAGMLPVLWLAAPLAALAGRWVEALRAAGQTRLARAGAAALLLLPLLGVAEATSRHDALARRIAREAAELAGDCRGRGPAEPWALGMRRALACAAAPADAHSGAFKPRPARDP
jgi:hypothetical protein